MMSGQCRENMFALDGSRFIPNATQWFDKMRPDHSLAQAPRPPQVCRGPKLIAEHALPAILEI